MDGSGRVTQESTIADFKHQTIPGLQIIGNRVNNGRPYVAGKGLQPIPRPLCQMPLVQNNLISNIVGQESIY